MKSFFQFLGEAQSQASMQAKKLNLKSDGNHGGWLDSRGKFVATTEDGKLKFVDKKKAKDKKNLAEKQQQDQNQLLQQNQKQNPKRNQKQKRQNQRVAMAEMR